MRGPWAERLFEEQIAQLTEQRRTSVPPGCGWADYEIRAVRGEGGFAEHAVSALGFRYEDFGMRESQAVSCQVCGGLFRDWLSFMRSHRLQCGWGSIDVEIRIYQTCDGFTVADQAGWIPGVFPTRDAALASAREANGAASHPGGVGVSEKEQQ